MMDLVIKNGMLILPGGLRRTDVGIQSEHIIAIGEDLAGKEQLDATGRYVLPGAIDVHVHLDVSSDDFYTGTVAAAYGGTTTVIDFVEPKGTQSLVDALQQRKAEAEGKAVVDYGLHMSLFTDDPSRLAEIPAVMDQGCTSFKLYMAYEGLRLEDRALLNVFAALAQNRGLPIVHAENHHAIAYLIEKFLGEGKTAPRYYPLSRPSYMEAEATGRVIALARLADLPPYIVHVSCADTLERIREAQLRSQPVYGETCPQYLLLTSAEYERPGLEGAKFVMSPPLREYSDQVALWKALACGDLQVVATDHCPSFFVGQKDKGRDAFDQIPGGISGVETRLALLYTFGVKEGRLSLSRWVEVCCSEPARLFGLVPQKGQIAVGADADLVIFDPHKQVVLDHHFLHHNVDYTPYEGMELVGYPETILLRGRVIVHHGTFVGPPGQGQYLKRRISDVY